MSQKGGSDLEVFDSLTKKSRPSMPAAATRAPAPPPPPGKKTLLGMAAPPLPPPPGSKASSAAPLAPPPPPSKFSKPPAPPPSRVTSRPPESAAGSGPASIPTTVPPPPPPSAAIPHGIVAPPPPPPPSAPGTGVQMDWDDEDEATTVFGREDMAPSFLRAPGPAAGTPAMPPLARPSGAPSVTSLLNDGKPAGLRPPTAAPAVAAAPAPVFAPVQAPAPSSAKGLVWLAALVLVVFGVVAGVAVYLGSRPGSLLVAVAGPRDKKLDQVQVYVDGKLACESSPCRAAELSKGNHTVYASAPGYETLAELPVVIEAGKESPVQLTLRNASQGTGISVSADIPGLNLFIDGQKIGALPLAQPISDMTPGEHKIRVESDKNENYELAPFEQTVTVVADKIIKLEPKLKVLMGQVKIEEGENASKASVLLVTGSERRRVPVLPANLKLIDVSKGYSILATRDGFEDYKEDIRFEDGQPSRTYTVRLQRKGAPEPSTAAVSSPTHSPTPSTAVATAAKAAPATAAGGARLNLNSIPVSNVILDGRPLGATPKLGISVPAGTHTVVFVHAQLGRKVQTVTVEAGETKTAAVRFQ
ncbi:MAG: PEGA domain-containing protein [Polyangiaceae bacterium]|nr:PEGA domain-containing protein [Polyangiaceae bacterium]